MAKKSISAIAAATMLALLAGCTVDAESVAREVETAMTSIEGVDGAIARLSYSGTRHAAMVKLYVPGATATAVDGIVDEALEQAWHIMPSEPADITIEVVAAERADDAALTDRDGIDLGDLGDRLGFGDSGGGRLLIVTTSELEERYGAWVAP